MEFLGKATIIIMAVIAIMIGYSQYNKETPKIPVTWPRGYWGRGDPKPDDTTVREYKVSL